MTDFREFQTLTSYDQEGGRLVGQFEEGSDDIRVVSYEDGFSISWGYDDSIFDALDKFNRHLPILGLYVSEDRRDFSKVDPHMYRSYDLSDFAAVKATTNKAGLMLYQTNLESSLGDFEANLFSNEESFDYGTVSLQAIEWITPELSNLEKEDPTLQDLMKMAEIDNPENF